MAANIWNSKFFRLWWYRRLRTTVCLAGWVHCCTAPIPLRVLVVTILLCFTTPECSHVYFRTIFITFCITKLQGVFLSLTISQSTTSNCSRSATFSPTPSIPGSFERYFSAVWPRAQIHFDKMVPFDMDVHILPKVCYKIIFVLSSHRSHLHFAFDSHSNLYRGKTHNF